jgi:regulator of sirC expression with transglutaminase-like and TPR domain
MDSHARERFAELVGSPSRTYSLAEAALLVAAEEKPNINVDHYLGRIHRLAEEARLRVEEPASELEQIEALNRFLYVEKGFCGTRRPSHDPRNSLLDEVLDRRRGLPISLAIVYMEVAVQLGLDVQGVSFPSHFLCKHVGRDEIIIDPHSGRVLTRDDCEARLRKASGERAVLGCEVLRPAEPREILARLLRNLKHAYLRTKCFERALACCDRILLLVPSRPLELRDRGVLYQKLECFGSALADFERFLELAPHDPAADTVRRGLFDLRRQAAHIH